MPKTDNYFTLFAEREVLQLTSWPDDIIFDRVVCIPAYRESGAILERLETFSATSSLSILWILVINQPDNDTSEPANRKLIHRTNDLATHWVSEQKQLMLKQQGALHLLVINRYTKSLRIPRKQGVGLARKIACDLAARLITKSCIRSPLIFSTDADVILPPAYLEICLPDQAGAGVFPFRHIKGDDQAIYEATLTYEKSLHDYVRGLQQAGSPYAYHSLGSCLVLRADSYIQVRGFPKRAGAEDFYLLNKINKLHPVVSLKAPVIEIVSRTSDRVPFGTGPSIRKICSGEKKTETFFYPEKKYQALGLWLDYMNHLCKEKKNNENSFTCNEEERAFLKARHNFYQLDDIINKIYRNYSTERQRKQSLHEWFDAFRTLTFIKRN